MLSTLKKVVYSFDEGRNIDDAMQVMGSNCRGVMSAQYQFISNEPSFCAVMYICMSPYVLFCGDLGRRYW